MKRRCLLVPVLLLAALAGCPGKEQKTAPTAPAPPPPVETTTKPVEEAITPTGYKRDASNPFQADAYAEPEFKADVPDFKVDPNFSNVGNWKKFAAQFNATQKELLQKNLFLVLPADRKQMAFIYEENGYRKNLKDQETPNFITTDSVLHTFHAFYDFLLRSVENGKLYDDAALMTKTLIEDSLGQHSGESTPEMKLAAVKNIAFLLVPADALGVKTSGLPIPEEARTLASAESKLIQAHQGKSKSPILDSDMDYSMFVPRGHYTRSERLKRFFVAMIWYGTAPLQVRDNDGKAKPDQIRQAYLLGKLLLVSPDDKRPKAPGTLWRNIYEPTAFMVGAADQMNPTLFLQAVDAVTGAGSGSQTSRTSSTSPTGAAGLDLTDQATLDKIAEEAAKKNPAQIVNGARPKEVTVKLMDQRFVVDSYILQQLVYPSVGTRTKGRTWPFGLDLAAALGSDRALEILKTEYKQDEFENYGKQMDAMRAYVKAVPPDQWQENVYWGWIDLLRHVVDVKGKGYPSFMQTEAWADKSLNAALANWAELRHDTILYTHQVVAEAGGGDEEEPNPPPRGYVEPDIKTYGRLLFLNKQLWKGLKSRDLVSERLDAKLKDFDKLLTFLVTASRKELANQPFTKAEEEEIHTYGDTMSYLNTFMLEDKTGKAGANWSEISSDSDRDMAVVADVSTNNDAGEALEEGVGHANAIYAIFPARGKLWLGRGAVFSYYEFHHPMNDRLTDEKWQQMITTSKAPPPPVWTKSFVVKGKDKER